MFGLVFLFLSAFAVDDLQLVGAALPDGVYYNCSSLTPAGSATALVKAQRKEDCMNTGWCIWETGADTCVRDQCLKAVANAEADCSSGGTQICGKYYITDKHKCGTAANPGTGELDDYADVYCRINQQGYEKKPIDKCFYDDMASRPGAGTCGNRPCAWNGSSSTEDPGRFCRASDAQICSDVIGDLPAFCACLGKTYCSLHPSCYVNGDNCLEDLCQKGQPNGDNCEYLPANQNPDDCATRYEIRINQQTGNLEAARLYCANKKNTDPNTCYWGLSAKVVKWETPQNPNPDAADHIWPDCQSVTTVDACSTSAVYKYDSNFRGTLVADTYCEPATLPSGWFPGTTLCINPGRTVPSVDAGIRINVPSLIAILLVAAAFVL